MKEFMQEEFSEELRALQSSIGKCEKVLTKLNDDCWQSEWTKRQLEAFYISVSLIKQTPDSYAVEQLKNAAQTFEVLIEKCNKILEKFKEKSPQKTLAERRQKAFLLAQSLIADYQCVNLKK